MIRDEFELEHLRHIERLEAKVAAIYNEVIREAARLGVPADKLRPGRAFSFHDYPAIERRVRELMRELASRLQVEIEVATAAQFDLADLKGEATVAAAYGVKSVKELPAALAARYLVSNGAARAAFAQRTVGGLPLSGRVWNLTEGFRQMIEMGLDIGIRDGVSATRLAGQLRQYLNEPDRLFRRVRDEHGQLHLSKNAAAYHPGPGVYRSSYKNALRLAANETNIAYRTADFERRSSFDFVVGIELHLSNTHPEYDICDELLGKYPKEFQFTGWHPRCRCFTTSVMKTEAELDEDTRLILEGLSPTSDSVNKVHDIPPAARRWARQNPLRAERLGLGPFIA